MGRITDTIKHLLIINGIFFLAVNLLGDEVYNWFALHYFQNPRFEFWQPLTHMFMHGSFNHILFNEKSMLGLILNILLIGGLIFTIKLIDLKVIKNQIDLLKILSKKNYAK